MGGDPLMSTSLSRYRFYVQKKEQSSKAKDTLNTIYFLRQIAIIQNNLGDYFGSESTAVEAIALLDKLVVNELTTEARSALYNQLGRINKALFNYDVALNYYNKALALSVDQNNSNIIQNNKFVIYKVLEQFESAEPEFIAIYNNSLQLKDSKQTNRALDNLAFIQSKLQRPGALSNLLKALNNKIADQDLNGAYSSYRHLTGYYTDRNQKDSAYYYAHKAYETARLTHNVSYISDALSLLIDLNEDPIIATYKQLNDSISKAKQMEENKYALVKYNYTQQERLAQLSELEKEQQKSLKILYLALGILVTCGALAVIGVLRIRHKKENLQQVYTTETRIAKKVHDEVANEVYHVMAKIQGATTNNEQLLDDLESIYLKTRDISKENSLIDLTENFNELITDLLLSYQTENIKIITKDIKKINWNLVSNIKKVAIYRVLQELMTNMKKHSKATAVIVTFQKEAAKLLIQYKDNGIGCKLSKHNGLHNTENRINSVNGTITFESEPNQGFKATMSV
jgi:signal transduction histidine kinase